MPTKGNIPQIHQQDDEQVVIRDDTDGEEEIILVKMVTHSNLRLRI